MNQDFTIESVIPKGKKDKFGNDTYDVKFAEHPNLVYLAAKSQPKQGDRKYGRITSNDYGERFKSEMKQETGSPQAAPNYTPRSPQAGKKSDDERSDDIRWGLCLKEANLYITKNESELDEDTWADAVKRYAVALYKVSDSPVLEEQAEQIDLGKLPF